MRTLFPTESCKQAHLNSLNPQSWLQIERDKLSKFPPPASSIESLIKVPQPPILPFFKPLDYVQVLSEIHEELESGHVQNRSSLYLLQFQVYRGLGEVKLMRKSLRLAWQTAGNIYDKIVFGAWLKYDTKQVYDITCCKFKLEFVSIDIASDFPSYLNLSSISAIGFNRNQVSMAVVFRIGDDTLTCDRQKIASLSLPFLTMLNGDFIESFSQEVDLSQNNISMDGLRVFREFSMNGRLSKVSPNILLEILAFANRFCCDGLKDACDRKLSSSVSSIDDALELMEYAMDENSPCLAMSCLQFFLRDLPDCLSDDRVAEILSNLNEWQRSIMVGSASFALYSLLSEASTKLDPQSKKTVRFLECLALSAKGLHERQLAFHQLGCARFCRDEYDESEQNFEKAYQLGHVYSISGLARLGCDKTHEVSSHERLSWVISSANQKLGWMYQERSFYCKGEKTLEDLDKATELDPTLTYPYMYRAASFMMKGNPENALMEINRVLGFKISLECLELRFCFYLTLEKYELALCDVHAILTLSPDYRMLEGRVAGSQLCTLVREHVEKSSDAECWISLYDRWSSVDDIGSLSVVYQMLESVAAKGVLYFRQSLLLLRLNHPEAAMRSLQMACQHASSDEERLVYEGWILYDASHCEEGLLKAEESIRMKRSFEAFFLKAYALADSNSDQSCSSTVISLLEDALSCPSDRLRKGQALNNLGSVYVDCELYDLAADCYINALKIMHTRAHQGLARVYFLKNDKHAAYQEMAKLIEKAPNSASAYEKRSEYCEHEQTKSDLEMVTRLDPLRVYPYRYRAAVLMDNNKKTEAIEELSRAIAFKADVNLLHLRAVFYEHVGNTLGALRDCRAALSVDPNHQGLLDFHNCANSREL